MKAEGRGQGKAGALTGQVWWRRGVGCDGARGEERLVEEGGSGLQDWEDRHLAHRLDKWMDGWRISDS